MDAMVVFTSTIKYLKDHLLKAFKSKKVPITQSDVHWILTVPAIWNDNAKQFMREAAVQVHAYTNKPTTYIYIKGMQCQSYDECKI